MIIPELEKEEHALKVFLISDKSAWGEGGLCGSFCYMRDLAASL